MNTIRYNENDELNNFDPMGKHYYSDQNNRMFGIDGDLEPIMENESYAITRIDTKMPKLYVTHFHDGITNQELRNIFELYGKVVEVSIHKSANGFKFAFVKFNNVDQAMAAIHGLHMRAPHRLQVKFAKEKGKNSNEEKIIQEPIIIAPVELNPPIMPLILSNARKTLKNSNYYKSLGCSPLQCYNDYALKLAKFHKMQPKQLSCMRNSV